MLAINADRNCVIGVEMRHLCHHADLRAVGDDGIALAQIARMVKNDGGLHFAAMDQRACAEPHRGADQQQEEKFSHHRCTVNSRLTIRILHSFVFVLKNAVHSPPPRWN
jgi:hypothetical protein